MRTPLLSPLGAMIIALRQGDKPQAAAFFGEFNKAADVILPVIADDFSPKAMLLRGLILHVRNHASSVPDLEEDRRKLVVDI